jgi:FkbM family methyltransferase
MNLASQIPRPARSFAKRWSPGSVRVKLDLSIPSRRLGTRFAQYDVFHEVLDERSIVYSFGIGEDLSFDLAMIDEFGCGIHAFDPTPRSLEWVRSESLPPEIQVYEWGIAGDDGLLAFAPPSDARFVSYTAARTGGSGTVSLTVKSLAQTMRELGHERVDVLKLDVEGSEYDVLDTLCESNLDVRQVLVEFHHRILRLGPEPTRRTVLRLRRAGYRVFAKSEDSEVVSFIRKDVVPS